MDYPILFLQTTIITDNTDLGGVVAGRPGGEPRCGQAIPGGASIPGPAIRQPGSTLGPRGAASRGHSIGRGPTLPANADLG